jgi:hypothetical protein
MESNWTLSAGASIEIFDSITYAEGLEEVLGLLIDVEGTRLGVLGEVESGDLGDVLVLALTLLFLELEGDTADGTTLNALHQVGGVSSDLVAETLGGNDGDLFGALAFARAVAAVAHLTSSQILLLVSKSSESLG